MSWAIRRGTTPPIKIKVGADLTDLNIHLSFDAGELIVKSGDDIDVSFEDGVTTIETVLTQEDTLAMKSGLNCEIQIRGYKNDGAVAMATTIASVPVERILEDGVLPHVSDNS